MVVPERPNVFLRRVHSRLLARNCSRVDALAPRLLGPLSSEPQDMPARFISWPSRRIQSINQSNSVSACSNHNHCSFSTFPLADGGFSQNTEEGSVAFAESFYNPSLSIIRYTLAASNIQAAQVANVTLVHVPDRIGASQKHAVEILATRSLLS